GVPEAALCRIGNAVKNLDWLLDNAADGEPVLDGEALLVRVREAKTTFVVAMDDDFNTCEALGGLFGFIGEVNALVADKSIAKGDAEAVQAARDLVVELMG